MVVDLNNEFQKKLRELIFEELTMREGRKPAQVPSKELELASYKIIEDVGHEVTRSIKKHYS